MSPSKGPILKDTNEDGRSTPKKDTTVASSTEQKGQSDDHNLNNGQFGISQPAVVQQESVSAASTLG